MAGGTLPTTISHHAHTGESQVPGKDAETGNATGRGGGGRSLPKNVTYSVFLSSPATRELGGAITGEPEQDAIPKGPR